MNDCIITRAEQRMNEANARAESYAMDQTREYNSRLYTLSTNAGVLKSALFDALAGNQDEQIFQRLSYMLIRLGRFNQADGDTDAHWIIAKLAEGHSDADA